jgi:hypothetical protein
VFYYAGLNQALLLNGRYQNLEYGSYAPGAPDVFLSDSQLRPLWHSSQRVYLILEGPKRAAVEKLVGGGSMHTLRAGGGKFLFSNHPLVEVEGVEVEGVEVSTDVITDTGSEER